MGLDEGNSLGESQYDSGLRVQNGFKFKAMHGMNSTRKKGSLWPEKGDRGRNKLEVQAYCQANFWGWALGQKKGDTVGLSFSENLTDPNTEVELVGRDARVDKDDFERETELKVQKGLGLGGFGSNKTDSVEKTGGGMDSIFLTNVPISRENDARKGLGVLVPVQIRSKQKWRLMNPWIVRELQNLIQKKDRNVVFLIETKRKEGIVDVLKNAIGMFDLAIPTRGLAGRLALLWKKPIEVIVQQFNNTFIDVFVKLGTDKGWWRLVGFYGDPEASNR
ncbi:hypothetical protein ACH5RR_036547 [Cinchona calisaya]|uniref:Uncharacterized protein n=1 Tax=Cinchona calisaya TaxID=153742 RepID=A0ABD2Y8Z8_9GENT